MFSLREVMKIHPTAFANLNTPNNFNVDAFMSILRIEKGSLPVIHPESFVEDVHDFFIIQRVNIEQLAKIYKDYATVNPLDNYDRIEETTDASTNEGVTAETTVDSTTYKETGKATGTAQNTRTSRIHGNIGVTTASDMATKHSHYFITNNLYRQVANLFVSTLCICTYPVILEGVNVW